MTKTIAYIDGYNLYNGLMDKRYKIKGDPSEHPLRKYLWLKLDDFLTSYLPPEISLSSIKYFTAPVMGDPKRYHRQEKYNKALKTIDNLSIHLGKHIPIYRGYSEKQTDVKMALHMYRDALEGNCESIMLLSGDSDQVPTIRFIRDLKKDIVIHVVFPPFRVSKDLQKVADHSYRIKWRRLRKHQFPDPIKWKGLEIHRPKEWS